MGGDNNNTTIVLVKAILNLTAEKRRSLSVQSTCQYIYCKHLTGEPGDNGGSCRVSTTPLSSPDELQYDQAYLNLLVRYTHLYIYPLLIFVGIFGNGLSCFIMSLNVRRNGYSANLYLALLAFVDCLFLLGSALPDWISHIDKKFDIRLLSDVCCRIVYWFGHFITHLSAGLVVSITVERFIAIQYPLVAHKIITVKHTHIVLICLIGFFCILDSRVFILVQQVRRRVPIITTCRNDSYITFETQDQVRCTTAEQNEKHIWALIDFAVYTLIPFLIIITLNCLIIRRLIYAQRSRQRMFHPNSKSTKNERFSCQRNLPDSDQIATEHHQALIRSRSAPTTTIRPIILRSQASKLRFSNRKISNLTNIDQSPRDSTMKQSDLSIELSLETKLRSNYQYETSLIRQTTNKNNMRLTILLLFVSCSFLILTLPAVVVNLMISTKLRFTSTNAKDFISSSGDGLNADTNLYYTIARFLMILNHSINFILYFVVGKRFRRDLKNLCLSYCRK